MLLPGFEKTIRPESIPEFLSSGYIADPSTIYQEVKRLGPGESVSIDWGGVRLRRYWSPTFAVSPGQQCSSSTEELVHLADRAVQCRLMSDVPLGAFLSGGLDSSAVVACMSESASEAVRTFSIGFDSPEFDERTYARLVAARYHTQHRERVVHADVTAMLDLCLEHYDEPFGDSSAIPTLCLSRLARTDVTVALSGDGGDEVFGGYDRYRNVIASGLRTLLPRRFHHLAKATEWSFDTFPALFSGSAARQHLSRAVADQYYHWISATDADSLNRILSRDLQTTLHGYAPKALLDERFARYRELPPLQQMQAVDMETYLPGDILVKVDRATMACSLEARAPWLDHKLAEFAGSLPQDFKLKHGIGKRIFRHAFESRLPPATLTRSKMGFGVPLAEWLRTSLKSMFEEFVFRPDMAGYLDLREVKLLWDEHQSRANDYRIWILWNILMLSRWHARYQCN